LEAGRRLVQQSRKGKKAGRRVKTLLLSSARSRGGEEALISSDVDEVFGEFADVV